MTNIVLKSVSHAYERAAPPNGVIFSHVMGNANVRNAASALEEDKLLKEFHTSLAVFENSIGWCASRFPGLGDLRRRHYSETLKVLTRCHPWRELTRLMASRLGFSELTAHETGPFCVDAVIRDLDEKVAQRIRRGLFDGVYCYEDGALQSFIAAKETGSRCLYDLPIGYWRAGRDIQLEESHRRPEWACTMPALVDSEGKLKRKDDELCMADSIVVATTFTKQTLTLAPFPLAPITVIPYGAPPLFPTLGRRTVRDGAKPLRILFVGGLSQRKGVADLLDAVVTLGPNVELTLIGRRPAQNCHALDNALAKHRWISSAPHADILREMTEHDVFVFPSLFEGFGLVILEAMAMGLPVITTPHTAGPDIITDGVDGFIVPIRAPEQISARLEILIRDRGRLEAMSAAAVATSSQFTWESYRHKLAMWVRNMIA